MLTTRPTKSLTQLWLLWGISKKNNDFRFWPPSPDKAANFDIFIVEIPISLHIVFLDLIFCGCYNKTTFKNDNFRGILCCVLITHLNIVTSFKRTLFYLPRC